MDQDVSKVKATTSTIKVKAEWQFKLKATKAV